MKLIQFLEIVTSRASGIRHKRALVALGAHGRQTSRATIRRAISNDYKAAIWRGIIRKV